MQNLVLGRRVGEKVVIGEGPGRVVLTLVRVTRRGQAKLGFEADRAVVINRAEVQERIRRKQAAHDAAAPGEGHDAR